MSSVHIRIGGVMGGGAPVYSEVPFASQTLAVSATSAAATIRARQNDYITLVASADMYVALGPSPVAVVGQGDLLLAGHVRDFGPCGAGDTVAAIDAGTL